jgi:hypothetical protein
MTAACETCFIYTPKHHGLVCRQAVNVMSAPCCRLAAMTACTACRRCLVCSKQCAQPFEIVPCATSLACRTWTCAQTLMCAMCRRFRGGPSQSLEASDSTCFHIMPPCCPVASSMHEIESWQSMVAISEFRPHLDHHDSSLFVAGLCHVIDSRRPGTHVVVNCFRPVWHMFVQTVFTRRITCFYASIHHI